MQKIYGFPAGFGGYYSISQTLQHFGNGHEDDFFVIDDQHRQ